MSDIPDHELNQDLVGQTTADAAVADPAAESSSSDEKLTIKERILAMSLYDVMLAVSILFIGLAIINMFSVLRVYSPSFPFGGFPWSTSEYQTLMF